MMIYTRMWHLSDAVEDKLSKSPEMLQSRQNKKNRKFEVIINEFKI